MDLPNHYSNLCVNINCIDIDGSGVLIQPTNADFTYVLTAAHCLQGTNHTPQEFNKEDIKISQMSSTGQLTYFQVLDYKIDPLEDLAVIIIEKNNNFNELITLEKQYRDKVTICGYPDIFKDKVNPLGIIDGEIISNRNGIEFKANHSLATFYRGDDAYLKGFSGSGIFVETFEKKLALIGIFTELKQKEAAHKVLVGVPVERVNVLLTSHDLPNIPNALPYYMANRISNKYKYLSEWSRDPRLNQTSWMELEYSGILIQEIQEHFLGKDDINILHIVGRSGIGKTHTTMRACVENPELQTVLYFPSFRAFDYEFRETIKNSSSLYKIVIDDISLQEWEQLNIEFSGYEHNIRILTIGVVPEHKLAQREGLRIIVPPTNDDVLGLIKQSDPSLTEEECTYLMRLCEKDLRLLILLLTVNKRENVRNIGNISTIGSRFGSIDSILTRILEQFATDIGDIPRFKQLYTKLCLLVDIGVKGSFRNELEYLSSYFNLDIHEMNRILLIANRCWLGITKSEFFEASPRALARLFFETEGWGLINSDLSNFVNGMPTIQMQKRFINRVEECGEKIRLEAEAALAAWFRETFPEPNLKLISDIEKSKIFKVYTEFSPELGLNWLKTAVLSATSEQLLNFEGSSGFFGKNKSRRYIVWLCEHLANFKEYFWDCEEILFRLAQHETEKHITNNSQGVWAGFFVPVLSNTEIPFNVRLKHLLKRINEASPDNITLILQGVKPVFNHQFASMVPPKVIGGRVVPEQWKPSSPDELNQLLNMAIQDLIDTLRKLNSTIKTSGIDFVIENLNSFIDFGFLTDIKKWFLNEDLNETQNRNLRSTLEEYISRIQRYGHKDDFLSLALEWKSQLKNHDIESTIIDFICRNYWTYYHATSKEEVEEQTQQLAREIIKQDIDLSKFIIWFDHEEKDITSLMELAKCIAVHDNDLIYKDLIANLIEKNAGIDFVIGYCHGLNLRLQSLPNHFVQVLDKCTLIHPHNVLNITVSVDISQHGFKRIINILMVEQNLSPYLFKMQFRDWGELLSIEEKCLLFDCILKNLKDPASVQVILRLANMWYRDTNGDLHNSDSMISILINVLNKCILEDFQFDDWDWNEVVQLIPDKFVIEKCKLLALALVKWKPGHSMIDNYALANLRDIAKDSSEIVMNCIGEMILDKEYTSSFYLRVYRNLFEAIDFDIVKNWIENHGIETARAIARHVKSPHPIEENPTYIPPLTNWLLEEFESDDRLYREFIAGRHSFEFFSVNETMEQHESLVATMQPYLKHTLKRIREWANYEIKNSESIIKQHQIDEARMERE
ncbi:TPA: trypsin-like peptidase domain-containing protein [Bacillus cereus]|nr:trypsin-like peptidase domain-containing protein [Bacillus cereus]HDR8354440.1 trypsin-like peptidase domain-containing protein [Bacillus cereus]HDR8360140.1 trypsin-like peptidase domain-containing protein [Bacillus cereus]HDR8381065.1 trypsin-like peptidase domain-containing protein [Bacillus cereus]